MEDPTEDALKSDSSEENIPLIKFLKKHALECDSSDDDITLATLAQSFAWQDESSRTLCTTCSTTTFKILKKWPKI